MSNWKYSSGARADKEWSARAVSRTLHIRATSAAGRLADFEKFGLLQIAGSTPPVYHDAPANHSLDSAVRELPATCRVRRMRAINLILENPLNSVRVFQMSSGNRTANKSKSSRR